MFSVAYNQLQYKNQFGMGLLTRKDLQHPNSDCLPIPTVLNEDGIIINKLELDGEDEIAELFDKMYSDEEFYDQGEGRNHSLANNGVPMFCNDGEYQIRGTMSDRGKAIIKLNIAPSSL